MRMTACFDANFSSGEIKIFLDPYNSSEAQVKSLHDTTNNGPPRTFF